MAMPTMGPENEVALWNGKVKGQGQIPGQARASRPQGGSWAVQLARSGRSWPHGLSLGVLRHQLGTVVGQARQQIGPAPVEEVVQCDTWVLAYLYQVLMRPSLQAH